MERLIEKILVAVDLGDTSTAALRYASFLARHFGSEITLMHAEETAALFGNYDPEFLAYHIEPGTQAATADAALHDLAQRHLAGIAAPVFIVVPGQPVSSIVGAAAERNADLIVMGTRATGWRRAFAGSVAAGVIHAASQPVLVVPSSPDAAPDRIERVICPIDFTDTARDAASFACALASSFQSELLLVHVHESDGVNSPDVHDRLQAIVPPEMRRKCFFRELVLRGSAAERVLECVEYQRAELMVMGVKRKWFRSRTVIGTTAERLLRFSPVPVLAVVRKAVAPEDTKVAEEVAAK